MAFDFGAGIGAMAETVTKFAGTAALEAQKARLQNESLILSNQLAGQREAVGRKEAHGYAMEAQGARQEFEKTENVENRKSAQTVAGIGASATLGAAKMGYDARMAEIDAGRAVRQAQVDQYKSETEKNNIANDMQKGIFEAQKGVEAALDTGDPDKIAAAQQKLANRSAAQGLQIAQTEASKAETSLRKHDLTMKTAAEAARKEMTEATASGDQARIEAAQQKLNLYDSEIALRQQQMEESKARTEGIAADSEGKVALRTAHDALIAATNAGDAAAIKRAQEVIGILEYSSVQERNAVAQWQAQAKLAETAMNQTQAKLKDLQLTTRPDDPFRVQMEAKLKAEQESFKSASDMSERMLRALSGNKLGGAAPAPGTLPPLNPNIITVPGRPNPTGKGKPTPAKPPALINTPELDTR